MYILNSTWSYRCSSCQSASKSIVILCTPAGTVQDCKSSLLSYPYGQGVVIFGIVYTHFSLTENIYGLTKIFASLELLSIFILAPDAKSILLFFKSTDKPPHGLILTITLLLSLILFPLQSTVLVISQECVIVTVLPLWSQFILHSLAYEVHKDNEPNKTNGNIFLIFFFMILYYIK